MNYSERHLRNTILLNLGESGLTQKQKGLVVGLSQQAVSHLGQRASQGLPTCQKWGPRPVSVPKSGATSLVY